MSINIYTNYPNLEHIRNVFPDIKLSIFNLDKLEEINNTTHNDYIIILCPIKKQKPERYIKYLNKFKQNRFLIFFESPFHRKEWYNLLVNHCDRIFSQKIKNDDKHVWIPYFHYLSYENRDIFAVKDFNLTQKTRFMCNNPILIRWRERLNILEQFSGLDIDIYGGCKELRKYGSKYKGNMNIKKSNVYYAQKSITKTEIFKSYKFILVIENCFECGTFTEKLIDALGCLSLPIYFGGKNADKIMPDLFSNGVINGFNYKNIDDLISYLQEMSDKEYTLRVETIKKNRDKYYNYFGLRKINDFIVEKIFDYKCSVNPLLDEINSRIYLN